MTSTLAFWTAHFCVHTCYRNKIINLELIYFLVNPPILKVSHPFQNTIKTLYMLGTIFGLCENDILDINIFGNSDIKFNKVIYLK